MTTGEIQCYAIPVVEETGIGGEAREFPATRWTLILSSRAAPEQRRAALADLLTLYWKPLYFCARRKGMSIEASKDAVQGLFATLLQRDFLQRLDPERGRFRGYLRASLDHFLVNEHERQSAEKRGGDARAISLDIDVAERQLGSAAAAADAAYDREWAVGLLERAFARLGKECEESRRPALAAALRFFQPGEPPSYAQAAAEAGLGESAFKAFLHRTRARFRTVLRDEVAHTVPDPADIDAEIEHLFRALA
jgi:RNA polymerase sigma-70 factor (ECF subfamily)